MTEGTKIIINVDIDKLNDKIEEITGIDNFNVPDDGIVALKDSKDNLTIGKKNLMYSFAIGLVSDQTGRKFELIADEAKLEAWVVPEAVIEEKV